MFKQFAFEQLTSLKTAFSDKHYIKTFIAIVFFVLLNAIKISLYNCILIPQTTSELISYKFWYTLLCCIILFTLIFSFRSRYFFLLFMIAEGVYCFTNISYYLYYHSYLHFLQWISLFKEAFISATHLANPKSVQLLVVFIDVPLALYIFFKYFKTNVRKHSPLALRYGILLISTIILIVVEAGNFKSEKSVVQYMDDRYTGETEIVERYGTLVNSAVNIIKNYSETKLIEKIHYGKAQADAPILSNSNTSGSTSLKSGKPNYVIIQVESMDANIVKQKYKDEYVMPFLSSLRYESIYYPYTLSYHQGGGTSDAEFSVINSVEPLDSFPAIKLTSYDFSNSVISKLARANYQTMAFHGNVGTFYNRNIALSKMGFEKFYDISSMNYTDQGWGAPDDKVFSFAADKIGDSNKPFLSYIITMTSHGPFESARNYYNNPRYDDIEDELVRNYYNSFNYVDESLKKFISEIRTMYPNTYIIIFGDHTPNLNSEEFFQASFIEGDKYFEFVPLYVLTPDKQKYTESSKVASFLDVSPTILYTSGLAFSLYSDGANLTDRSAYPMNIPLKGSSYDRQWLYDKISTYKYTEAEPIWKKYLPSFISPDLIEKHKK